MRKNKDVFDAILKDKIGLINYGNETANKIEFIFSHSALGVGWDNPNIFNIATLSNSYSEIKKRQEIGRGLRICVNKDGQRIYDKLSVEDTERINQLTVIPNETYETFVTQYQEEIKEVYGTSRVGAGMTHTHKGKPQNEVHFKRSENENINKAFKRFWTALAKKTNYTVGFDETALIERSIEAINNIKPRIIPYFKFTFAELLISTFFLYTIGIKNNPPIAKRIALYVKGPIYCIPALCATKANPQISAETNNNRSVLILLILINL